MKNKMLLAVVLVLAFLISGCERERREFTLTEEEERLLCELYIDEESIKKGMLVEYQWKCLEQIRFGREYLEEKYPGISFDLLDCEPKNKINKNTMIMFYETTDKEREKAYTLLIKEEQGQYRALDDYYGKLIEESYDQEVADRIMEAGVENCAVYTKFFNLMDKEIDGNLTYEEIAALRSALDNKSVDVYVDSENSSQERNDEIVGIVKSVIRENELYGAYEVFIIPDVLSHGSNSREYAEYVQEHRNDADVYRAFFDCYEE